MAEQKKISGRMIGIVVLVLLIAWVTGTYNSLVGMQVTIDEKWGQVETQYQRRADLVPQLVAVVEGAADFEKSTLQAVTEARTNWLNTKNDPNASVGDQIAASNQFDSALSRLLVTVENYPTLTATAGFRDLQSQLEGTENRISTARIQYNEVVTPYNVTTRKFPANIVAMIFGFEQKAFFESKEGAENAPKVEFDFNNDKPVDVSEPSPAS